MDLLIPRDQDTGQTMLSSPGAPVKGETRPSGADVGPVSPDVAHPGSLSPLSTFGNEWSSRRGYLSAAGGTVVITVLLYCAHRWVHYDEDADQSAMLYLPFVIAMAIYYGFRPAVVAALLSFAGWDFFFVRPQFSMLVYSIHDYVMLGTFLISALATGHLAAQVREEARRTAQRENETSELYQATNAISREVHADRLLPVLVEQVTRICGSPHCLVLRYNPDKVDVFLTAGAAGIESNASASRSPNLVAVNKMAEIVVQRDIYVGFGSSPQTWAKECNRVGVPVSEAAGLYVPLYVLGRTVGVMYVRYRQDGTPFSAQHERVVLHLANHAAVVIARLVMGEEAWRQARHNAVLDERNRLARDVHDSLSHMFTGIKFLLEAADRIAPSPNAFELVSRARQLAVDGTQEARRSVWALRATPEEADGGLPAAVRAIGDRLANAVPIQWEVLVTGSPRRLSHATEQDLLRTCQEAVGNAVRHAKADRVRILLDYEADGVVLSVVDDGRGFDAGQANAGSGFGLTSMRERCERIGAELDIKTEVGQGTCVRVRLPWTEENAASLVDSADANNGMIAPGDCEIRPL
ncbi:MAG: DUF4118 domain-containing protein [Capsulimonadaceae bacterium]